MLPTSCLKKLTRKEVVMNEFICDDRLMKNFIIELIEATERHRIFWHKDYLSCYRINNVERSIRPLDKFAIYFDNKSDAVVIYIDELHRRYTPADDCIWSCLKELESKIQKCIASIESTLNSMMEALAKLNY